MENSNTIRLFYANSSQQYADWIDILEQSEPRPPRNVTAKQEKLDRFLSRWSLCSVYILEIWRLAGSRWLGTCYMLGVWFGPSKGWKMEAKHRATRLGAELAVLRIDYSSIPLGPLYSSWLAIIQNFEVIHWLIDAYVVCSTLWSLTDRNAAKYSKQCRIGYSVVTCHLVLRHQRNPTPNVDVIVAIKGVHSKLLSPSTPTYVKLSRGCE